MSHDAAWSLAYSGVVRGATLGVSIAIARLAGTGGAGALGVALQVTALGSMLAAFNLPQSLARHLAETEDPLARQRLLRTSGLLVLGFALFAGAALSAASGWLASHVYSDRSLAPVLAWCGPLVIATACCGWVEGALQGIRRFATLTRWGAVVSAMDLLFGVAAAFFGVAAVLATRAFLRGVAVATAVARWFRSGSAAGASTTDFAATARPLLGIAGPALLSAIIVLVGQALLRMLLVRGSGLAAAGHLQAADSIAQGLLLIPSAASVAFMRSVSSDRHTGYGGLASSLRRALERVSGYNLPLCLAVIGLAPWGIGLFFGRGFEASRPVLVLLACAYGPVGLCAIFGAALLGRGEVWLGVVVNSTWAAVLLGVYGFATAPLGATGAALAVLAAYLVLLLIFLVFLAPRWSVPLRTLLPAALVSIASLGIGSGLALTPRVPPLVTCVVCLALGLAIFLLWGFPALAPPVRRERPAAP